MNRKLENDEYFLNFRKDNLELKLLPFICDEFNFNLIESERDYLLYDAKEIEGTDNLYRLFGKLLLDHYPQKGVKNCKLNYLGKQTIVSHVASV
jgi:hypothetical protein